MADPHVVEALDGHDRLTVRLYRGGLAVAALGLLAATSALIAGFDPRLPFWLVTAGAGVAALNVHLYDKRVRWIIGAFAWTGALLPLLADGALARAAGLGFSYAALSGFALKEQFCFRIPLLRAVPAFLAGSLLPHLAGADLATAALLGVSGIVYAVLVVAKMRMPLHFDVGDKGRYQV